jgi:hypothetical protein
LVMVVLFAAFRVDVDGWRRGFDEVRDWIARWPHPHTPTNVGHRAVRFDRRTLTHGGRAQEICRYCVALALVQQPRSHCLGEPVGGIQADPL